MSVEKARESIREFLALVSDNLIDTDIGPKARAMRKASKYGETELSIAPLIVAAQHDPVAFDACAELLDSLIQNDKKIPDNLALMARDVMRGELKRPSKRGQDGMKKWGRDGAILTCVGLARIEGLPDYANGNHTHITATRLVADCLSEYGVVIDSETVRSVVRKASPGKKYP